MRQINSPRLKTVLDQPKQTLGSIFEKTKLIPSNLQACQTKLQLFKRIKQNLAQNNIFIYKLLLQSCPTLCDPIDVSPPGSPIPGTLQARILEWVAISFSNACKWKVKVKSLSRVWLPATPWTAAYQAPLSKGFSRQEYWSGVPLPSPVKSNPWSCKMGIFKLGYEEL